MRQHKISTVIGLCNVVKSLWVVILISNKDHFSQLHMSLVEREQFNISWIEIPGAGRMASHGHQDTKLFFCCTFYMRGEVHPLSFHQVERHDSKVLLIDLEEWDELTDQIYCWNQQGNKLLCMIRSLMFGVFLAPWSGLADKYFLWKFRHFAMIIWLKSGVFVS